MGRRQRERLQLVAWGEGVLFVPRGARVDIVGRPRFHPLFFCGLGPLASLADGKQRGLEALDVLNKRSLWGESRVASGDGDARVGRATNSEHRLVHFVCFSVHATSVLGVLAYFLYVPSLSFSLQ